MINRIKESLKIEGFRESVFSPNEIFNEHGDPSEYYATRFASKEAVYKAISKYIDIDLRTIETLNQIDGSPYVVYNEVFSHIGIEKIHISITTESGLAMAYCVVE